MATGNVQWIEPPDFHISGRLDAGYYEPEFVELLIKLRNFKNLVAKVEDITEWVKKGIFDIKASNYTNKGVPFVRISDIDGPFLTDTYTCIPVKEHQKNIKSELLSGDLVIAKVGTVDRSAIIPSAWSKANFSQNNIGIKHNGSIDQYFFAAFFQSKYAKKQLLQSAKTQVQAKLNLDDVRQLLCILPDNSVQKAIGLKLRKAERFREKALDKWIAAEKKTESSIGCEITIETFEKYSKNNVNSKSYKCISVEPASFWTSVDNEIGAQYYHPRRINAQKIASAKNSWDILSNIAKRIKKKNFKDGCLVPPFIGLDAIDPKTGLITISLGNEGASANAGAFFESNDIIFSRLRPYLNKVSIWPIAWGDGCGSGELLVYRPNKDIINPYYLFFILKSYIGLYQVVDVTSGSTHPRVDAKVVDSIKIPRFGDVEEENIGNLVFTSLSYWYESQQLIPESITNIEALIDGTLNIDKLLTEGKEIEHWLKENPSPKKP